MTLPARYQPPLRNPRGLRCRYRMDRLWTPITVVSGFVLAYSGSVVHWSLLAVTVTSSAAVLVCSLNVFISQNLVFFFMQDEHEDESGGLRVYLQRSGCTDELRRHYGSGSEAHVGVVNMVSPPHLGMMGITSLPLCLVSLFVSRLPVFYEGVCRGPLPLRSHAGDGSSRQPS